MVEYGPCNSVDFTVARNGNEHSIFECLLVGIFCDYVWLIFHKKTQALGIRESLQSWHITVAALESTAAAYWSRGRPLRHRSYWLAHIPPHISESS